MDDFVTEFNEKTAAKSREVCERIEREDAERRGGLSERERAILDMWPRFEDGEYVWFGDEVEMQDEIVREVWTFTLDVNAEGDKRLYLNGFQGLFVLPGERVKRPAPKVLDADGVEIKVGDTVWHHSGFAHGVVISIDAGSLMGTVRYVNEGVEFRDAAKDLAHTRPDSWERLEEDARKGVCEYAGACRKRGTIDSHECDGCRFDADGDDPTCEQQMAHDIVRRAKALAGVEVARDED